MCGIAGVIDPALGPEVRLEAVRRMCAAMRDRGPDDAGEIDVAPAALGMRRLAIFDPVGGRQPMTSACGRYHLVFNGAIVNHRELRRELEAQGVRFRTDSDTEVLLESLARHGEACLPRLRGMFAFALWDGRDRSLFLARDALGIKPLYVRRDGERLLFASEASALLASGLAVRRFDAGAVADYLAWGTVPAPRTIFEGVESLLPGERLRWRDGRVERRSWWTLSSGSDEPARSSREFSDILRSRLEDSVRAHRVADVPVGAFLSGGLDSSTITALMAREAGAERLRTFSIGFEEAAYSEATGAREVAAHFGTIHHEYVLTGAEVARDIETILSSFDQPAPDGLNTYYASRAARQGGVKVALSGLGGDELFGGYASFRDLPRMRRWLAVASRLPSAWRGAVAGLLAAGSVRGRKLADFVEHGHDLDALCALQRRLFSTHRQASLLAADVRASLAPLDAHHPRLGRSVASDDDDSFRTIAAWELRTYMADVLLRDADVMSMAHSLEVRVPLLDVRLVEWLWAQPAEFFSGAGNKPALAASVADVLPPAVRSRRKRGFTLPIARWMRGPLRPFLSDVFSRETVGRSGLLDPTEVAALWSRFGSSKGEREWFRVWSLGILCATLARTSDVRTPGAGNAPSAVRAVAASPGNRGRRTLLLAPELFEREGGIQRTLRLYLRALGEICDDLRAVVLGDRDVARARMDRYSTDALRSVTACGGRRSRFAAEAFRASAQVDRIVVGHVNLAPVAWACRRARPHLRYYVVAHGIDVWKPLGRIREKALADADGVLCVSEHTRTALLARSNLDPRRLRVVHNALDPSVAPNGHVPPSREGEILVVSRLDVRDAYKGVDEILRAMPRVRAEEPGARLRVVGTGDDLARLRSMAGDLGVADAVEFAGRLSDAELAAAYGRCSLFALPSTHEGFGIAYLEAMAHGKPCLGARAGATPEVIVEGTGLLVEAGDVDALASRLVFGLRHAWDPSRIRAHARTFGYDAFRARLVEALAE